MTAADVLRAPELPQALTDGAAALDQMPVLEATIAGMQTSLDTAATQIADLRQQLADAQSNTAGQTYERPSGPGYVRWEALYKAGDTLQAVMDRAGPGNVLTLPADEFLFGDFTSPKGYMAAARLTCRGLAGSGPGRTRLRLPKMTSKLSSPTSGPPQAKLLDMASATASPYLGGLTVTADDITGVDGKPLLFNGFTLSGSTPLCEHLDFQHASRGSKNAPPGETGALTTNKVTNGIIRDVTIDCRDDTGKRVATSPFMGNNTAGLLIERMHAHHALAGTVTFWRCSGITTRRLRSEHNGSAGGGLNGNGINHELCSGTIRHEEPVLVLDWHAPGNSGLHLSASSSEASAQITVVDPVFDGGPWPGTVSVYSAKTYLAKAEAQKPGDITVTAGGKAVAVRISG